MEENLLLLLYYLNLMHTKYWIFFDNDDEMNAIEDQQKNEHYEAFNIL